MIQPLKIFENIAESDFYTQISEQDIKNGLGILHFPNLQVPAFEFVVGNTTNLGTNFTPTIYWVDAVSEVEYDITAQLTLFKIQVAGETDLRLLHKVSEAITDVVGRTMYFKIVCVGTLETKTWYTDTVCMYDAPAPTFPDIVVVDGGYNDILETSHFVFDGGYNSVND